MWLRHDLQTFKRRLAALEKKSAEEGRVLTESQIAALERKREEQLECGEMLWTNADDDVRGWQANLSREVDRVT